ncbi:MAG TPA: outer membrane lipoprotein carrier protein LolA [Planctomycetota bacterium]|nr:outer membrane lipoprotein carrier protein LolA [Planctomycetota bacterium]
MTNPSLLLAAILSLALAPMSAQESPSAPGPQGKEPAAVETPGPEVEAFLEAGGKKWTGLKSLALKFRQEKKLRILRRPRVSEGDLIYTDGKLSIIVRGRDGEVETRLVLKDGFLRIFYPKLKRLEVIEVGSGTAPPGASMSFLSSDPRQLKEAYRMSLTRGEKGDVLTLVPRDSKSPVKQVELTLVDFEVRLYKTVDTSGDEMKLEILSSEVNAVVPPDRFEMDVPVGTEEVYPAGGKKSAPEDAAKRK